MKNIIKEYYQDQELSDDLMNKLLEESEATYKPPFYTSYWAMAAMILLTCMVVTFSTIHVFKAESVMIEEVALNHQHEFEPEVISNNVEMISDSMKRLPFDVDIPSQIPANYELIGARYCSIDGQLAVHIKLRHQGNNQRASLFITQFNEKLDKKDSLTMDAEKINISYWPEASKFFVFVEDFYNP